MASVRDIYVMAIHYFVRPMVGSRGVSGLANVLARANKHYVHAMISALENVQLGR